MSGGKGNISYRKSSSADSRFNLVGASSLVFAHKTKKDGNP